MFPESARPRHIERAQESCAAWGKWNDVDQVAIGLPDAEAAADAALDHRDENAERIAEMPAKTIAGFAIMARAAIAAGDYRLATKFCSALASHAVAGA